MSKKPNFLDTPEAWMRTPRAHFSPVDYACSVERDAERQPSPLYDYVIVAIFVAVCTSLAIWG